MLQITSGQLEAMLGAFAWPFVRVLALVATAPVIGHRAVPQRVKIGLALLITALIAPALPASPPLGDPGAPMLLAQQLLVGVALGLSMHVAFAAVALAGDLIGLQMGLSFATFVDPQHSTQTPMLGTFLGLLATLLFFAIDGHLLLVAALAQSFAHAPVSAAPVPAGPWGALLAWGGELFRIGLHLALPVLAAMLACNIALGVLMRAAPQLNLLAVGFPIALVVGFVMLALLIPYLSEPIQGLLLRGIGLFSRS
jgi:flagellar biosynthetic protein FliR